MYVKNRSDDETVWHYMAACSIYEQASLRLQTDVSGMSVQILWAGIESDFFVLDDDAPPSSTCMESVVGVLGHNAQQPSPSLSGSGL